MDARTFTGPQFVQAINDYYYLMNNGYPVKGSLKLVGDRYELSGEMRTLLFRGISAREKNLSRQNRLTIFLQGKELHIDGYNVLFTLMNYKLGKLVFISSDGICRDAGSLFGKIKKQKEFTTVLVQLLDYLVLAKPDYTRIFFDSPVSFSGDHRQLTEKLMGEKDIPGEAILVHSADHEIAQAKEGIICTSDSAIIDNTSRPVADLSYQLINHYYKPQILNLNLMLATQGAFQNK